MSEVRNLAWHRTQTSRILNHLEQTPDQDFAGRDNAPWENIDAALNEAQTEERNEAIVNGSSEAFKKTQQFTWAASSVTFTMPSFIDRESVYSIHDVTSDTVGFPLFPSSRSIGNKIFWLDNRRLQWMTTGPGADTTLEISYLMEPAALTEETQEADWLPYSHRHLLNWSAACIAVDMADQKVPARWLARRDQYRSTYHLFLSRGSPAETNVPRIRNHRRFR